MTARKLIKRRQCLLCNHVERSRIEMLRLAGVGIEALLAQFDGLSRDSIYRHMRDHVTQDDKAAYLADIPLQELLARAADEGVSLLDFFKIVRATLMRQFQLAASVNDQRAVAALAGRLNETLDLIGRLTGEMLKLTPGTVVNNTAVFVNSPIFIDLQSMLVRKLAGHPEALARVVEGLQELEARVAPTPKGATLIDAMPLEHAHGA
jgi:hypothetical protein